FFITCQIAPGGTLLYDLPLFFGNVIVHAPALHFLHEARNFLLVLLRPGKHSIKDFLHLLFCHGASITDRLIRLYTVCPSRPTSHRARDGYRSRTSRDVRSLHPSYIPSSRSGGRKASAVSQGKSIQVSCGTSATNVSTSGRPNGLA